MKVSYGITVHNEAEELQKLLQVLNKNIDKEDEIVVCVDGDDEKVEAVLGESLASRHTDIVYKRKLEGDFSAQKNSVIEKASGDYIFHIDADEYPHRLLLLQIKRIIEMNDNVDLIFDRKDGNKREPFFASIDGFEYKRIRTTGSNLTGILELADLQLSSNNYNNIGISNAIRPRDDNANFEKPIDQKKDFVRSTDDLTRSKNVFQTEDKNNFYTRKISCWACSPVKHEIYLRANGYVSPCCILGDVERNEPKEIIKDYKKINLHHTDLKDILEGEFFKDISEGINGGEKRLQGCYHACGVK